MTLSPSTPHHDTAHAKINLFLHVTGRRADGYHLLDSLAVFAGAADRLRLAQPSDHMTLTLTGPFSSGLKAEEDNLVLRAARLLKEQTLQEDRVQTTNLSNWSFELEKNLPVASGIGGGSADAACALRLLAAQWDIPENRLLRVAEKLGADVPVCIAQNTMRMQGIGEILTPLFPLPPIGMLLINPGIGVSTPDVFRSFASMGGIHSRDKPEMPTASVTPDELFAFLHQTENDLQAAAIVHAPIIGEVLAAIGRQQHCALARMSGSGATCFGLFADPAKAEAARKKLEAETARLGWWTWAGALHHSAKS